MLRRLFAATAAIVLSAPALAQTFNDVPADFWASNYIETLAASGITSGCGGGNYCPSSPVTRAQMAVFLERGMRGSDFQPSAAKGNVFLDVGAGDFAASFIEQLFLDGITAGCGGNKYCPNATVTRAQMAVFLLRAKHGSSYSPPPATSMFIDVPLNHWAVHWIEQLAREGVTVGCGSGNYCPSAAVTRDQMAVFLVRTFDLKKPGTLTLFRKRIGGFFEPLFDEVPMPYSSTSSVVANVTGIPQPTTYTLDTFKLVAKDQTFTISSLTATDSTGLVVPFFNGLSDGHELSADDQLVFDVVSPLTRGAHVQLTFSFMVVETGKTFVATYSFSSN